MGGATETPTASNLREKAGRRWPRLKTGLLILLLGTVLGLAAGIMLNRAFRSAGEPAATVITSDTLIEKIRHVQDLVTTEYHYKNIGELRDQKDFRGVPIPFTERRILYTFQGTIKAGVDVSAIVPQVDGESKTVTLTIPEGKIIAHEMPPGDVEPFEESVSFFASFTMNDYAHLLDDRRAVVEAEFLEGDYLAEAQKEAGRVLEELLSSLPGMEPYEIVITYAGDAGET